ncbi:unnamed protein product, partial [Rotaria sp. Silwood2]
TATNQIASSASTASVATQTKQKGNSLV